MFKGVGVQACTWAAPMACMALPSHMLFVISGTHPKVREGLFAADETVETLFAVATQNCNDQRLATQLLWLFQELSGAKKQHHLIVMVCTAMPIPNLASCAF